MKLHRIIINKSTNNQYFSNFKITEIQYNKDDGEVSYLRYLDDKDELFLDNNDFHKISNYKAYTLKEDNIPKILQNMKDNILKEHIINLNNIKQQLKNLEITSDEFVEINPFDDDIDRQTLMNFNFEKKPMKKEIDEEYLNEKQAIKWKMNNDGIGYYILNYTDASSMPCDESKILFKKAELALENFESFFDE